MAPTAAPNSHGVIITNIKWHILLKLWQIYYYCCLTSLNLFIIKSCWKFKEAVLQWITIILAWFKFPLHGRQVDPMQWHILFTFQSAYPAAFMPSWPKVDERGGVQEKKKRNNMNQAIFSRTEWIPVVKIQYENLLFTTIMFHKRGNGSVQKASFHFFGVPFLLRSRVNQNSKACEERVVLNPNRCVPGPILISHHQSDWTKPH